MSEFDSKKDYYRVLGADQRASDRELERLYKRMAARRHPDKGGSEEAMKALNEAYRILHNQETRRSYDAERNLRPGVSGATFVPRATATAQDVRALRTWVERVALFTGGIISVDSGSRPMDVFLMAPRDPRRIGNRVWRFHGTQRPQSNERHTSAIEQV